MNILCIFSQLLSQLRLHIMALNLIGLSQLCHLTKSTKHKLIWILNRHDYQFQVPKTYPLSYDAHFLPEKKIENQFFLVQVLSRGC